MSTVPLGPLQPLIGERGPTTAADLVRVNAALEEAKGNKRYAAQLLGVSNHRVDYIVKCNPTLKVRWHVSPTEPADAPAMTEEELAARAQPEAIARTEAEKLAGALAVGERKMNKSLRKLGFRSEEIAAISSIEEFAGQHFNETLSIMHGGMLKGAMRLMILADRIEQDYLQNDDLEDKDRKWWWDQYFRILESLRMMHEQSNKAALTKAMIEMKRNESKGGGGKPGFSPLSAIQINVSDKKDVTIVTDDKSDDS